MHDPHLITVAQPSSTPTGLWWACAWGLTGWAMGCRAWPGSLIPLSLLHSHPACLLHLVRPAAVERRCHPRRVPEKLSPGSRGLVVPSSGCSHMAAPGASWHNPQQILLVQLSTLLASLMLDLPG